MTYRELLKLYKAGKLDEQQRRKVAADIERQDAISEYLFDEAAIPVPEEVLTPESPFGDDGNRDSCGDTGTLPQGNCKDANQDQYEAQFVSMIQRSIRRAFIKMGLTVGAIVLAIVLCAVFLLPRAVSLFYYDPTAIVGKSDKYEGMSTNRMSLDMSVYSELFLPGHYRNNVIAESRGYGEYDITIAQNASFNGQFTDVTGKLKRGKLTLYNTNVLKRPVDNVFLLPEDVKGAANIVHEDEDGNSLGLMGAAGTAAEAREALENLVDKKRYLAYVSLTDITDYETVYQWFEKKELFSAMMWYAVYAEDTEGYFLEPNVGFSPQPSGTLLDWNREAYPLLSLLDSTNTDGGPDAAEPSDAGQMQTHFFSLLNYLTDHDEILNMMNDDPIESMRLEEIIRYVEENGLRIYGFAIAAPKEDLLELEEDPLVSYIYTTELI